MFLNAVIFGSGPVFKHFGMFLVKLIQHKVTDMALESIATSQSTFFLYEALLQNLTNVTLE